MRRNRRLYLGLFFCCAWLCAAAGEAAGLKQGDFYPLATGGIDDSANSYAWGIAYHDGALYVGTNRHHIWGILQGMSQLIPGDLPIDIGDIIGDIGIGPPGPSNQVPGEAEWAEEMRGRIYRYKDGDWEEVHRAAVLNGQLPIVYPPQDIKGYYPESYGYRTLGVFEGQIYAIGVGTWVPNMPISRILRSTSGDPGHWDNVTGILDKTLNPRGFVEYRGELYTNASIPGATPTGSGAAVVYRFTRSGPDYWEPVSTPGFGNLDNAEIYYLEVFNDCLYASTVNYVTGFEVWKTCSDRALNGSELAWTNVIRDGFGDTWNQYGMTMESFGKHLYVGTAVGAGMVLKDNQPVGSRPLEIIRIDANDKAELIVGSRIAFDPPPGWPRFRKPKSRMSAGFGNPFNVYTWHLTAYDGVLYAGTLDLSGMLLDAISEIIGNFANSTPRLGSAFGWDFGSRWDSASRMSRRLPRLAPGADLWKSRDGVRWEPVTLNGFGNDKNAGIRRIIPVPDLGLVVGTGNGATGDPRGGFEVWVGDDAKPWREKRKSCRRR